MTKHSPAPFTVEPADHLGDPAYAVRAADGDLIAVGMVKADAVLLAAAPDMLEALKEARGFIAADHGPADGNTDDPLKWDDDGSVDLVRVIDAALSRATHEGE